MKIKKDIFKNEESSASGIRINKYLADSGICSRREADTIIEKGRITVDGIKATLGTRVLEGQTVCLDGQPVEPKDKLVLIAFNKPIGIISTTDRRVDDNIIDYIDHKERIFPIGRLDKDSSGLILLTNDGDIVNKILRCGNRHEKEYEVEVNKLITKDFCTARHRQRGRHVCKPDPVRRLCRCISSRSACASVGRHDCRQGFAPVPERSPALFDTHCVCASVA